MYQPNGTPRRLLSALALVVAVPLSALAQEARQIAVEAAPTATVVPTATLITPSNSAITVAQAPLAALQAPVSDLKVDVWSNRTDGQYLVGETLNLYIRTNRDANIAVLNVDAQGRTTLLYPNQVAQNNRIQGNTVYALPADTSYQLRVSPPLGANLITVVATTGNDPIIGNNLLSRSSGPFAEVTGTPATLARHIEVEVTNQPSNPWAITHLPIQVVNQRLDDVATIIQPPINSGFGLELRLEKPQYRLGEALRLTVAAERDCQLTLVNVNANQQAVQLYPNQASGPVALKAGQLTWLPAANTAVQLSVLGPTGPQELVALCTPIDAPALAQVGGFEGRSVYATLTAPQWQQVQGSAPPATARTSVRYDVVP